MKSLTLSLVLVGICYPSNCCAMDNDAAEERAKNLAEAKGVVVKAEIMMWQDSVRFMMGCSLDGQTIFQRFKEHSNSADQAQSLFQSIVNDQRIPLPVRQDSQVYLDRILLMQKLYPSS